MNSFIIAHRGASALCPENTAAAVEMAAKAGATAIEVDTTISQDGHMVIHHDMRLGRCNNGDGYVADRSMSALAALDCGSWFSPQFSAERMLSLPALIALCNRLELSLNLEIKPPIGLEKACVEAVAKAATALDTPLLVSSFNHQALRLHQSLCPTTPRAVLFERIGEDFIQTASALAAEAIHFWNQAPINDAALAEAKSKGFALRCFTVNDPQRAMALRTQGIDAIFSDDPGLMLSHPELQG